MCMMDIYFVNKTVLHENTARSVSAKKAQHDVTSKAGLPLKQDYKQD